MDRSLKENIQGIDFQFFQMTLKHTGLLLDYSAGAMNSALIPMELQIECVKTYVYVKNDHGYSILNDKAFDEIFKYNVVLFKMVWIRLQEFSFADALKKREDYSNETGTAPTESQTT